MLARESTKSKGCGMVQGRLLLAGVTKLPVPDPRYICQRCTNCCRWPGFVRLTNEDITRIAAYLRQSEFRFIQTYTRLRPYRDGLALQDQADGSCVFLDGKGCTIHPVKPAQCTGFPNEWRFPGWRSVCKAIAVEAEDRGRALEPKDAQRPTAVSESPPRDP